MNGFLFWFRKGVVFGIGSILEVANDSVLGVRYRFIKKMPPVYLLLLVGIYLFLSSCDSSSPTIPSELPKEMAADVEMAYDVTILYSDSAQLRLKVEGPVMKNHIKSYEGKQEFPNGIKVTFYDLNQNPSSYMTAKKGIRLADQGLVIARDSVVWRSIKNETLETNELTWNDQDDKVRTNRFVVITKPGEIIYSRGFEANQDFSDIKLFAIDGRKVVENLMPE